MIERYRRGGVSGRGLIFGTLVVVALLLPAVFLVAQASAPEQATGVVLAVRTRAPLGVDSFDLGTGDGRRLTFSVGRLDLSTGFDAGHLVAHQLSLQLVVVTYRHDGDRLVAVRLADGPAGPPPASGSVPAGSPTGSP